MGNLMTKNSAYYILTCMLIINLTSNVYATLLNNNKSLALIPTGKGYSIRAAKAPPVVSNSIVLQNGIDYHAGRMMSTTVATIPHLYFLWYGNWTNNTATEIIRQFAQGIGSSDYYRINATYVNEKGVHVLPKVNFRITEAYDDYYSHGKNISEEDIISIINNQITNHHPFAVNSNAIYFVLTSADVTLPGFCNNYCGWHTAGWQSTQDAFNTKIKYVFVGNAATQCPDACTPQKISPNNNAGADGMVNIIAHELVATITDPYLDAWYDANGNENADKCAWNFGQTQTAENGSQYNIIINGLKFLVQQNWVNANGGYCALSA